MTLQEKITEYKNNYQVVNVIDLDHWHTLKIYQQEAWLQDTLQQVHRAEYLDNQRIILTLTRCDNVADILKNLRYWLFEIDITCFFVVVVNYFNYES